MVEEKTYQTNDLLNYYLTMNMNNICRICLEKGKLMPIFDPVKPPHFSILIMACAQVQVQEGDGLPPYICHRCVSKLNVAFQFKTQCESSDARLRNCFVQQMAQDQLHIPNSNYITDIKNEHSNNSNISIAFATTNESLNNNSTEILHSDLTISGQLQNQSLTDDQLDMHNVTMNQDGNLTELKLEYNDLQTSDVIKLDVLNMNLDVKSSRPKKIESHQCGTCGKVFRTKPSLVHHIRIHTGERPYTCHLCDKRFINGGHLHTHMRTHTGEKNHVCPACHKAFATAQQLTKHTIAVHTSERPYACTYCTKRFASSSNLRTHTRIHTGEKNFRCDQCGKAFCTKGQLEQHMRIHTGEKAFLCEYCHKRFSQKCHLLRHLKTHRVP